MPCLHRSSWIQKWLPVFVLLVEKKLAIVDALVSNGTRSMTFESEAVVWDDHDPLAPPDFVWGVSTSSFQIEGSFDADGRTPSIWDGFPTRSGDNASVACDSYRHWPRDHEFLSELGVNAYRFSLSWSRLLPEPNMSQPNPLAVQAYRAQLLSLKKRNIQPWLVLYHWDLPVYLQQQGGWLNRDTIKAFRDLALVCFRAFGDLVHTWITMNEPLTMSVFGFGKDGISAPGRCTGCENGGDSATEPYLVSHHLILAHSLAAELLASLNASRVGIVLNLECGYPFNASDPSDVEAAQRHHEFELGWFADPIFGGRGEYPSSMVQRVGQRLPRFSPEERLRLQLYRPAFFAVNHYSSMFVQNVRHLKSRPSTGFDDDKGAKLGFRDAHGQLIGKPCDVDWIHIVPQGLARLLRWIDARYDHPPIYVTESGTADSSAFDDALRQEYLSKYIPSMLRTMSQGIDVRGYFVWSLMDNFEWAAGFRTRFGLYFSNFSSPKIEIKPRRSAGLFSSIIRRTRHGLGDRWLLQ